MALRYRYAQMWTLIRDAVAGIRPDLRHAEMSLIVADLDDEGPTTVGLLVAEAGEELASLDMTFPDPYGQPVPPLPRAPANPRKSSGDCCEVPTGWPLCHGSSGEEWERAHFEMACNEKLWSALAFDGVQSHGKTGLRESRRCPCCGSTFSRPISAQAACELLHVQAALHARSLEALTCSPPYSEVPDRRAA
jgi:hypothetical protein